MPRHRVGGEGLLSPVAERERVAAAALSLSLTMPPDPLLLIRKAKAERDCTFRAVRLRDNDFWCPVTMMFLPKTRLQRYSPVSSFSTAAPAASKLGIGPLYCRSAPGASGSIK